MNSTSEKTFWFDQVISGVPPEAANRLYSDSTLLEYITKLKGLKMDVPKTFYRNTDVRSLYKRLLEFCKRQNLPSELVQELTPLILTYMKTGTINGAILLIGEPGCGKTTTAKLVCSQILGIPQWVISIPQSDTRHGLCGESKTFSGADVGGFAEGILCNRNLINGFVLDEVDKCPEPQNRASITNELLSVVCSETISDFRDNYLGFRLPSLKYCPILMTANCEDKVNPILLDRCTVIHFPNADLDRLEKIITDYTKKKQVSEVFNMIDVDYSLLRVSSERLLNEGIASIRQHKRLVEIALGYALEEAVNTDADRVALTCKMLARAEQRLLRKESCRRVGFSA